jgi:hypothetical protein
MAFAFTGATWKRAHQRKMPNEHKADKEQMDGNGKPEVMQ